MPNKIIILGALAGVALVAGCNRKANPAGGNATAGTNDSLQAAKAAATNAWQKTEAAATNAWTATHAKLAEAWAGVQDTLGAVTDYTYEKKDDFVGKAGADLNALDAKIKELSDKIANANAAVKAEAQTKLQSLRDQRAGLAGKLEAAKDATAANWDEAKTAFRSAYDGMKASLKDAWQWLADRVNS